MSSHLNTLLMVFSPSIVPISWLSSRSVIFKWSSGKFCVVIFWCALTDKSQLIRFCVCFPDNFRNNEDSLNLNLIFCIKPQGWELYCILLTERTSKQGRGWIEATFQKFVCLFVVGYYVESNGIRFYRLIVFRCLFDGCKFHILWVNEFLNNIRLHPVHTCLKSHFWISDSCYCRKWNN